MMNFLDFDPLHNFISPVTGRILSPRDYVPYGDLENVATPSPILIDVRLDLIKQQQEIEELQKRSSFPSELDFVVGKPSSLLPNAQALSNLEDGYLYTTDGILSSVGELPLPTLDDGKLWIGDANNQPTAQSHIEERNLPNLGTTDVPTPTGDFVGKVWMGTSSDRPEASSLVAEMFADIEILNAKFLGGHFIMQSGLRTSFPLAQFLNQLEAGALLKVTASGSGALESVPLLTNQILIGGVDGSPEGVDRMNINNLPTLMDGYVWMGDAEGLPQATQLPNIGLDATFILQQPDANIPNAQALVSLGTGMSKIIAGGEIAIAIPDQDYATVETLERIKAETETFKDEAATSATEASEAAGEATGAAGEATAAAGEATGAAAAATGSAAAAALSAISASSSSSSASSSADDAEDSADDAESSASSAQGYATAANTYLNQLLTTGIVIQGDVNGTGPLSSPIQLSFEENPVFLGNSFLKIPIGNTAQRPSNPTEGMVRFNNTI